MVQVPDQFEVEMPSLSSGSYVVNYFFEETSIFQTRRRVYSAVNAPNPMDPGVLNSRAQSFTGSLSSLNSDVTFNRDQLGIVAGRTAAPVMRKFRSAEEIFADSVLPAPPDIVLADGGQLFEGDDYYVTYGDLPDETTPGFPSKARATAKFPRRFKIALGTRISQSHGPATLTSSSDSSQVSDDIWAYSYPFENRYVGLDRFINPGYHKSYNVSLTQSTGFDAGVGLTVTDIDASTPPFDPPFTSSIYTLQNIYRPTDPSEIGLRAISLFDNVYAVKPRTNPAQTEPTGSVVKFVGVGNIANTLKSFYGFWAPGTGGGNAGVNKANLGVPHVLRHNPGKFQDTWGVLFLEGHLDRVATATVAEVQGGFSNVLINGWKQGVYHALPTKSFCYFRYNRYGQFRDMFEQRPDTKYHSTKTGASLEAPVKVRFVAGTAAAATASNPTGLNPNVSGMFDIEGKMGKPFNDAPTGSI